MRIREIARAHGLNPGNAEKAEVIKAIQRREGNFDCFATACDGVGDHSGCLGREDCFAVASSTRHS